ncbi:hypothetical protein GW916_01900 [bacterium]|nr:hypothetical protein [bacterium]
MGEIETNKPDADEQEKTVEEDTDTSENNDGADDDAEAGDDADDNNDDGSDDEEETDDDEDDTDDKKSKKSTAKDDEDEEDKEPPVRKRPSDFAKERIERKKSKSSGKDDADTDNEDEDDDIDPADEKTVGKIVEKALKPFIEKQMKDDDDKEVKNFLKDNPDFAPYEAKARKYMSHPSRKDVPVQEIFYGVAGKDLLKLGAKRKQIADKEAKKTKSGGGASDAGGVKPVSEYTKDELEAKQAEVRKKLADR